MLGEANGLACLAGVTPTPRALDTGECGAQFEYLLLVLGHRHSGADVVENELTLPGTPGMGAIKGLREVGLISLHPAVHAGVQRIEWGRDGRDQLVVLRGHIPAVHTVEGSINVSPAQQLRLPRLMAGLLRARVHRLDAHDPRPVGAQ